MSTETPTQTAHTISLTGVLRRPCCPDHIPHDERATESEALDRIIAHMQIDALEPALMDPNNGPFTWTETNVSAFGNFTLCSARFEIRLLSVTGYQRLKTAWLLHRDSEQYRLSRELDVLHQACETEVATWLPTSFRTSNEAEQKRRLIRSRYRLKSQPLEIRLQAIYDQGRPA